MPSGSYTNTVLTPARASGKSSRLPASGTPLASRACITAATSSTANERWVMPTWSSFTGFLPRHHGWKSAPGTGGLRVRPQSRRGHGPACVRPGVHRRRFSSGPTGHFLRGVQSDRHTQNVPVTLQDLSRSWTQMAMWANRLYFISNPCFSEWGFADTPPRLI